MDKITEILNKFDFFIFKDILIGTGIFILMWLLFVFSLRMGVKKNITKSTYRRLIKEYKAMKAQRTLGVLCCMSGIFAIWFINFKTEYLMSFELLKDNELIYAVPFVFMCAGLYLFVTAFIKAMSEFL